jgi:hypothetical protein
MNTEGITKGGKNVVVAKSLTHNKNKKFTTKNRNIGTHTVQVFCNLLNTVTQNIKNTAFGGKVRHRK